MDTVINRLKKLDLFKEPVQIYAKGQRSIGTFIGGCTSFIFIVIITIMVILSLTSTFSGNSIQVQSFQKINETPNRVYIGSSNFTFALMLFVYNGNDGYVMPLSNSYFNIYVEKLSCPP